VIDVDPDQVAIYRCPEKGPIVTFADIWVFVVPPLVGAIGGVVIFLVLNFFFGQHWQISETPTEKSKAA
jgi:hypothetical protein